MYATLVNEQLVNLALQILEEIEKHKIKIYQFPDCDSDEDEDFKQQDNELKVSKPKKYSTAFAVSFARCN
jgi:septin family protein